MIHNKRILRVSETPDWGELRLMGSSIKNRVVSRLSELPRGMERNVTARDGIVHWTRDTAEANTIVYQITASEGVDGVAKVKSIITQETGLSEYFVERGISA